MDIDDLPDYHGYSMNQLCASLDGTEDAELDKKQIRDDMRAAMCYAKYLKKKNWNPKEKFNWDE
jgi:hypothetical protein